MAIPTISSWEACLNSLVKSPRCRLVVKEEEASDAVLYVT